MAARWVVPAVMPAARSKTAICSMSAPRAQRCLPAGGFKAAAAVNETGAPAAGVSGSAATGAREPKLIHEGLPPHLLPAGATGRELDKLAQ